MTGDIKTEHGIIGDEEICSISDFFKIFGDSTRLKLLWILEDRELTVTQICDEVNMSKSAISHQLKGLKNARIVKYRRVGKNVFYSLDDEHVSTIIETARNHLKELNGR